MTAMDAATRNAERHDRRADLYMNKVRQAAITREIIEMVSGAQVAVRTRRSTSATKWQVERPPHQHQHTARVIQVIGPVVDVEFEADSCRRSTTPCASRPRPSRRRQRRSTSSSRSSSTSARTACAASRCKPTDGMVRGMKAIDTGAADLGAGRSADARPRPERDRRAGGPTGPVETKERWPIHRPAPSFEEQSTELEMFETGIKVIDLLEPYLHGRQDRPVRRRRRRQDRHHHGAHQQHRH